MHVPPARMPGPRRLPATLVALGMGLALLVAVPPPATHASTHTTLLVDSPNDAPDADLTDNGVCATAAGECTLRAAVQTANAGTGLHEISLPEDTYVLDVAGTDEDAGATGDLDLTGDVVIDGVGSSAGIFVQALDGNDVRTLSDRIFEVHDGATVTISDITVRGGLAPADDAGHSRGGGIFNRGDLTLEDARIIDNTTEDSGSIYDSGGGIFADYATTTTLVDTFVRGNVADDNGGGIRAQGTVSVSDVNALSGSNIGSNEAEKGGGIYLASGDLAITGDVTLLSNTAALQGGGLFVMNGSAVLEETAVVGNDAGSGGGLHNQGTLSVTRSTIRGNDVTQAGGGIRNQSDLTVENSTISGNRVVTGSTSAGGGGALFNTLGTATVESSTITANSTDGTAVAADGLEVPSGTVTVANTIVAGNADSDSGTTDRECEIGSNGTVTSGGHNLEGGTECGFTATGDIQNGAAHLAPLADNGGPTATHALGSSSDALDAGDTALGVDQRGLPRPFDGDGNGSDVDDIGAFELVTNQPPAADAGPSRDVVEGGSVELDGFGSSDADGSVVGYDWTVQGAGQLDDPSAMRPWFDAGSVDGPATVTVELEVTDDDGATDTDTVTVTVQNVAPTVSAGADQAVDDGDPVSLSATFVDPAAADVHDAAIDWGDGSTESQAGVDSPVVGTHTYAGPGTYTVEVSVTDDDGGTDSDTLTATVDAPSTGGGGGGGGASNEAPTADDVTVSTAPAVPVTIDVLGDVTDPDGDPVSIDEVTGPDHGTTTIEDDVVVYVPEEGFVGQDQFDYSVSDDRGGSDTATIMVTVEEGANPFASLVAVCDGAPDRFDDDDGGVHESGINCLAALDLLHGFDDGQVKPARDVSRGQVAGVLARLIETVEDTSMGELCPDGGEPFDDTSTSVFANEVACLARIGIVSGHADGTYRPTRVVNRAELATLLDRVASYFGLPLLAAETMPFPDVSPSGTHASSIGAAADAGILHGFDDGRFRPTEALSRGQFASALERLIEHLADRSSTG